MKVWLVALGGALGSVARYGLTQLVTGLVPHTFPFGTFLVNAIGCAVFGVIAGAGEARGFLSPPVRAFCLIGLLGGFTTFSSYAFDAVTLARGGTWGLAALNAAGQVFVGLAAVAAGFWLGRTFG
jgi:CrcB protein